MKISELINRLEQIKEVEGDIECVNDGTDMYMDSKDLNVEESYDGELRLFIG